MTQLHSHYTQVNDLRLHYLEAGEGEPILLLHGFPTSSHLYRNILPQLAQTHRAIALDLPGYGLSDKPLDVRYDYDFYADVLDSFLDALGILIAMKTPGLRDFLVSPKGIVGAMQFGVANKARLNREVLTPYTAPFESPAARKALIKAGSGLGLRGLAKIARELPGYETSIRLIYGEKDRVLPDVAKTMARLQRARPDADLTALPNCGHFLQEDDPDRVGHLIGEFLNRG